MLSKLWFFISSLLTNVFALPGDAPAEIEFSTFYPENLTSGGNKFYDFPKMQLIKYGAAMSFAFKEELNELVIFRRCYSL